MRGAQALDLLYARRLLARAQARETPMGRLRVISVEGLIGFKLHGFVNAATRTRDLDDMRALCSTSWICRMNSSDSTGATGEPARSDVAADAVLASEAGIAFQPPLAHDAGIDPLAEWLSLMEVVEMLSPAWPVRDRPFQGNHWRL